MQEGHDHVTSITPISTIAFIATVTTIILTITINSISTTTIIDTVANTIPIISITFISICLSEVWTNVFQIGDDDVL